MATPTKDKCTPAEWAVVKAKARLDLEYRLAHGLPHGDKPLAEGTIPPEEAVVVPKDPKARKPKAPKAA